MESKGQARECAGCAREECFGRFLGAARVGKKDRVWVVGKGERPEGKKNMVDGIDTELEG